MCSLQCEHLSPSSNFTLVARRSATSDGTIYRSDGGFYRTEVQVASTGVWIVGAVTVLVIFLQRSWSSLLLSANPTIMVRWKLSTIASCIFGVQEREKESNGRYIKR